MKCSAPVPTAIPSPSRLQRPRHHPKLTNVGYTLKNIKPVAHIASMECVLSTNKSSGIDTWEKFLQAAEKNPDGTVYGTTGSISTQRLYMTKLTDRFHGDLKIRHTAYTSGHEVSTALLGKHITAGFQVPANILPYANSGDFNVIAISRKERRADLPNTPTFRELYADKMTPRTRSGSISARGTARGVQQGQGRSHRRAEPLIEKAMKDPEVIENQQNRLDAGYLLARIRTAYPVVLGPRRRSAAGRSRLTNRILGRSAGAPRPSFSRRGVAS
ncbi:MAG: tripartite tricarboxylate transporter substrate-binding protein [Bilophila wadsworthia]